VVLNNINRIEVVRVYSVALEQAIGEFTLQRRETKTVAPVVFEKKLD